MFTILVNKKNPSKIKREGNQQSILIKEKIKAQSKHHTKT
jgi:hypothetical protein